MGFQPMYAWPSSCRSSRPERAVWTSIESVPPRYGKPLESPAQSKDDVNIRFDFHGLVAEQRGLVAPLPDRGGRRLDQKRRTGDDFKLLNRAFLGDDGVEAHSSLDAGLPCDRGINRLHSADDFRFLHAGAHADALGGLRLGWGRRTAHSADDPAHHAAGHATWNAARDAAGTGVNRYIGGKLFFLDHFHVFRNHGRRHHLALLNDAL